MATRRKKRIEHEQLEQIALFQWAKMSEWRYPELFLLHANAIDGKRHIHTAINLKRKGAKAGVPDIHLPVARQGYHSLWIELKYGKNKPSDEQEVWLNALNEQGNLAVVCYGFEEARDAILEYLGEENGV